ncbi:hypothetical protein [Nostoc sp. NMS4]|nr:hypothetical protein [Nostoc sp. NMS4]MBN3926201.1 hypothetical protein [Nostoc sp. NMS4]
MLGYTEAEMRSLTCADLTDPDTLADNRAIPGAASRCHTNGFTDARTERR